MKTNRNRIIAFLLIGGACMNGAFGQKAYTLDECIQAALTNNVRMKNANNELEMAKQDKKKALPIFSERERGWNRFHGR